MTNQTTTTPGTFNPNTVDEIMAINEKHADAKTVAELIEFAMEKSKFVEPGCSIRLTAEISSYYVMNQNGVYYIGCHYADSTLQMPFRNKKVFELADKTGKIVGMFQKLF